MANLSTNILNKANGSAPELKNKIFGSEHPVEDMVKSAGERIGAMASDFAHTTSDSVKSGRDYVKVNPFKGAAIAVAVGLVAGSLLTMYMRSQKV